MRELNLERVDKLTERASGKLAKSNPIDLDLHWLSRVSSGAPIESFRILVSKRGE